MTTNFILAAYWAQRGFPVFPTHKKFPLTEHGQNDGTTDLAQIEAWSNEFPGCHWAFRTGPEIRYWGLDVDGPAGKANLETLCERKGFSDWSELTPVVVQTPSGGLHLYFKYGVFDDPRSRAGDIGPGLDTKARGGSISAPGNPGYRHIGASEDMADAVPAPRWLTYLATLNTRDRTFVLANPTLKAAIHAADPCDWQRCVDDFRNAIRPSVPLLNNDAPAMERQARTDCEDEADRYASLTDGRRIGLFLAICRVGKYAANGAIDAATIRALFLTAASTNGAARKYGVPWVTSEISRALDRCKGDALPPLANRFRCKVRA